MKPTIIPEDANDKRLRELVVLICALSQDDKAFGKVKLNKLLFYCDFIAYRDFGRSITGHEYQKLPNGPAPRRLLPVVPSLGGPDTEDRDIAVQEVTYYGKKQHRPIALRDPDTGMFGYDQVKLVENIVKHFWDKNAAEISDESHKFIGWQVVELYETIPYQLSLVKRKNPSEHEQGRGLLLEELATECRARS